MPKLKDLTGQQFGRLTAIEYVCNRKWKCVCECGNETVVQGYHLKSGASRSCGCLQREIVSMSNFQHGHTSGETTREFSAWASMKTRCTNPNITDYQYWGGKGITVFPAWLNSFANFFAYIGKCPEGYVLDRINSDGDYEPGNVRWASVMVQNNNRSNVKKYECQGKSLSASGWDRELGNVRGTFRRRHVIYGWDIERAITQPVRKATD